MALVDELERLQTLRASNAISEAEFETAKAQVLNGQTHAACSFSSGFWDNPKFLTILIWAAAAFVLVFGVFRMSWHSEALLLFVLAIGGIVGLAFYGTRKVWGRRPPEHRGP